MQKKGLIIGIVIAIVIVLIVVGVIVFMNLNKGESNNEAKEEESVAEEKVDFLNDNDSYFIMIDGKKYLAGDKISDLSDAGYVLRESDRDVDIPANKYMIGAGYIQTSENKNSFSVTPYNTTDSSIKVSEAVIGGITLDSYNTQYDEKLAEIEVYGGIKLGSTMDEIKQVFGEPSSSTEGTTSTTYRYESEETYRNYRFTFDEEGKLSGISWQNLVFEE